MPYSKKALLMVVYLIILSFNAHTAHAKTAWEDNFANEELEEWNTYACSSDDIWNSPCDYNNTKFEVTGGSLSAPSSTGFNYVTRAFHNSSIAYGTWSFDWTVSENKKSFDAVEFAFTDHKHEYNWTGTNPSTRRWSGYSLVMVSWDIPVWQGSNGPGLHLIKFINSSSAFSTSTVKSVKFNSTISGTHHIDITRNNTGEFNIFFDSELVINITDNRYQTSEMFAFVSWEGDSSFDNIYVSDTIEFILGKSDNSLIDLSEFQMGVILFGIVSLAGISLYLYQFYENSQNLPSVKGVGSHVKQILTDVFGDYSSSYFVIGKNLIERSSIDPQLEKDFPPDLLNHKFLMHPIRLAMVKILMENTLITSAELRQRLGISWGDFSTHSKALRGKKYIATEDKIVDGSILQVISIEQIGIDQYESLIQILISFIDQSPLYSKYIEDAIKKYNIDKN